MYVCMHTNLPHRSSSEGSYYTCASIFRIRLCYLRMCVFAHLGIRRFIYTLALVLGTKLTTQLQKKHEFFKTGIVSLKRLKLKPISVLDVLTLLAEKKCECLSTSGCCINTSSKMANLVMLE